MNKSIVQRFVEWMIGDSINLSVAEDIYIHGASLIIDVDKVTGLDKFIVSNESEIIFEQKPKVAIRPNIGIGKYISVKKLAEYLQIHST